jgi:hypothetical protein
MRVFSTGAIVALGILAIPAAHSQSPDFRARMASEEAKLVKEAGWANQACGSALTAKFDWTGVKEADFAAASSTAGESVARVCGVALSAVQKVCDDPSGKEAVKEKIKSLTCSFGKTREITLKNGKLSYKIEMINFQSVKYLEVYEYLENEL